MTVQQAKDLIIPEGQYMGRPLSEVPHAYLVDAALCKNRMKRWPKTVAAARLLTGVRPGPRYLSE
jgi:hypothetical protein